MCRKLILLVSLVSILGLVGSASAATVELLDTDLLSFVDTGWDGVVTAITDIPISAYPYKDPSVQYDWTYGADTVTGWNAIHIAYAGNPGFAPGDTWVITFKNVDPGGFSYPVSLDVSLDGSAIWGAVGWTWINPGNETTLAYTFPAFTTLDWVHFEVGTGILPGDSPRPFGSSTSIQVVPEPTTIALLGLGGLLLRRRKR